MRRIRGAEKVQLISHDKEFICLVLYGESVVAGVLSGSLTTSPVMRLNVKGMALGKRMETNLL